MDGITPCDASYYSGLGYSYFEMREYDKAIEAYEQALRLIPNYDSALNNMGWVYYSKGEYSQALVYFKRALDVDEWSPITWFNLALVYLAQEEYEDAYESYRYPIEEFKVLSSWDRSIFKISELLIDKSDLSFAYLIRGDLYKELGRNQEAKEDIENFLREFKGDEKWKITARELLSKLDQD